MNIGDRFEHRIWRNQDMTPAVCEVTRVWRGWVYYRFDGYQHSSYYFAASQAERYVGRIIVKNDNRGCA